MHNGLRLMLDPARDGATNMAVDEAMLLAAGHDSTRPTLRLYRWAEPTLSLGYFQPFGEIDSQPPAVRGLPVVRRMTGGGAIVHAGELTYCLLTPTWALPALLGTPAEGESKPAGLYDWMHTALAEAIASLAGRRGVLDRPLAEAGSAAGGAQRGPFWCFQRRGRFDLLGGGEKIAGSAQRRTARAVLQHGSVILRRSFPAQPGGALSELLGRGVGFDELAAAVTEAVRRSGHVMEEEELTDGERDALAELRRKHASPEWLHRR